MVITPPRSLLFMPANNARTHEKAVGLAADALIFDLEDAVAEAHKADARQCLSQSITAYHYPHKSLFLRINHPDSLFTKEDVALLAQHPKFCGVVVPKVEQAETMQQVSVWMQEAGCSAGQSILAMIETPLGVLNAQAIAQTCQLSGLIAGTNDLAAALHLPASDNRSGLHHALAQMVLAARASGIMVFDGVYNRITDEQGLARECAQGREWGFDGKSIIHPSQIATVNSVFSPNAAEVEQARQIVANWQVQHNGVTTANGAMIEELHVRNAQRILAMHKIITQDSFE